MNKIICIGSASKDVFFPTDKGDVTETPEDLTSQKKITFELGAKYQIDDRYEAPGGVAANVSQGISRLGVEVGCCSKIGSDEIGKWILDELGKEGVDISLIQIEEGVKSDLSAIIVDTVSGEHTIFFNRDANEKLEVIPEKIKDTEWYFISALNGTAEKKWDELLGEIINFANKNGIKMAFNPGQRNIKDNPVKIVSAVKNSEIVILNKDEAIEIVSSYKNGVSKENINSEIFLIKELKNLGPRFVVLTDGMKGSWAYDGKEVAYAGSQDNNPIETTGAGDSFSSGFLSAHVKGKDVKEALQWGAANGGNVVKFYGAKEGLLAEDEIQKKIGGVSIEILK